MDEKADNPDKTISQETRVAVTVSITVEDAERIRQAFAEGKLAQYGVIDVRLSPDEETEQAPKQWSQSEQEKWQRPPSETTPSR